jgi:predicted nucleic acid-binding protein
VADEPCLDSNVVLHYILPDHPDHPEHSPHAQDLFVRISRSEITARATAGVVSEKVITLDRQQKVAKALIGATILDLFALPDLIVNEQSRLTRALDHFVPLNLPYIDAYHAVAMNDLGCAQILSFDRHFDRVPGVERAEP